MDLKEKKYFLNEISKFHHGEACPVKKALVIFSGKWRTWILFELSKRPSYRFGELKKEIPNITNTMLTATLRDLEGFGIVHREQFNEIPPRVEYSLTESGHALIPVFFEIGKWAEDYLPKEKED